jgi:N-carbamoylputrescine amidase
MSNEITLGLIQMACGTDIRENYDRTIKSIKSAAKQGANIICTQELFKSPYFCQVEDPKNFDLAEKIHEGNKTIQELSELATKLDIVLIASLFEKRAAGIYHNTAVVFDADGKLLGKYRKMHIPDDPRYYEKFYFTPGDLGYRAFDTKFGRIGVLICWDQWFPEAARLLGLQGVEIIFIPTAIGYSRAAEGITYDGAWKTVQQGHAVANACFLAAINRVGFELDPMNSNLKGQFSGVGPKGEQGINFWGQSFVADPDGVIVKEGSKDQEEILICTVDIDQVEETKRLSSFPYRDRRVDSYQDLLRLFSD